jgi:hypothetical protein
MLPYLLKVSVKISFEWSIIMNSVIATMLCENTGKSILDSGGDNGRNWQRNAGQDLAAQAPANVEFRVYKESVDVVFSISTYHFMNEKLSPSEEFQALLDSFVEDRSKYEGTCEIHHEFIKHLQEDLDYELTGIYGEGKPITDNTYNGSDSLTQCLFYTYFTHDGNDYACVQTHNGADVRGGYSMPVMFEVNEELGLFDNARGNLHCNNCDASWSTDDAGYNWYDNNSEIDLKDYSAELREDACGGEEDIIVVNDSHEAFCPCCGKGKLKAGF